MSRPSKYFLGIGRRKTAVAGVKLSLEGNGEFALNGRTLANYFPTIYLQKLATDPLNIAGLEKKVSVVAKLQGGGVVSQAQAVSLGIARALVAANPEIKATLKKHGFLTRDARKKERKKPGLKRARRAPQWQKR
ncbi:MAG: 30S ribosomal protein S9 [Candidatus Doudnabacteria bacterium]|nr:30S ribosomal protein S9 [Candidatus Doudnabacteria bacterium]